MKMPSKGSPIVIDGYGRGIISVPLEEYKENRVHMDQLPKGANPDISTEKRDKLLKQQIKE